MPEVETLISGLRRLPCTSPNKPAPLGHTKRRGTVCKAYSKQTDAVRAVKTIKKTDIQDQTRFNEEIEVTEGALPLTVTFYVLETC